MNSARVILIRNAAPQDFGGGERFPVFLAQELTLCGYGVVILSRHQTLERFAKSSGVGFQKSWWLAHQNWSGWRIILFPFYVVWQVVMTFYYLFRFLSLRANIIHIQSKDDFIAATIAGRILRKRVIWTDHADLKHIWKGLSVWYKNPTGRMVYWAARLAHKITVVSNSEKGLILENIQKTSSVRKKITVVYNGVADTKNLYSNNSKKSKIFTFCIAGRLVVDKGISEAISAFEIFNRQHTNSQMILIGDGPDRKMFEEQAGKLPISFLGHQSNPLPEMAKADCYLHPTYHEGFSVSLIEASMLGLPIIATKVGGNPEIIINQKTGILVPPRNFKDLNRAMERLYIDPNLKKSIAKNAREQFIDKFIFHNIVQKQFIPLYNGIYEDSD